MTPRPTLSTLFPYTTLFRSCEGPQGDRMKARSTGRPPPAARRAWSSPIPERRGAADRLSARSEEHTSELQSPDIVCRLLLEKKKKISPALASIQYVSSSVQP